ncbi:MAG: thermonuclease family protein [Proteobacteria bacterium]|nr:thermonuclease family protein [Pseudomonadota bacterium]
MKAACRIVGIGMVCAVLASWVSGCEEEQPAGGLTAIEMCFYADERCEELSPEECMSIGKCDVCACNTCTDDCAAGQAICSGNSVSRCTLGADGCHHWGMLEACPGGCAGGICAGLPDACTPNAKQCSGNIVQQCVLSGGSYQWVNAETCPSGCANGMCASAVPGVCTPNAKQCSGNVVQQCKAGADGSYQWVNAGECPNGCEAGACVVCREGEYKCFGKTLKKCVSGASASWQTVKTCQAYCSAESGGCTEDLPACTMKPGSKFLIRQWTDGDTLWIVPKSEGKCNDQEYSAEDSKWKDIRFDVRVEGIDAPECTKAQNSYYYYTCIQDTKYTNDNERMGYDSWAKAMEMLPFKSEIIVSCEKTLSDGSCGYDATRKRRLAYIGYERDNASYDFATELARQGLAFANVEFASTTSKIGQICSAQKEAISAKRGLWGLSSSVNGVLNLMSKDKQKNLKNLESRCNSLMK